jgi:transcription-repair coupling factor (superfamily II helicase)
VQVKRLCRLAQVEKIDAGPKGATIAFRHDQFANPAGLVDYISRHAKTVKVKPDQKLVILRDWPEAKERLKGVQQILKDLAKIAASASH